MVLRATAPNRHAAVSRILRGVAAPRSKNVGRGSRFVKGSRKKPRPPLRGSSERGPFANHAKLLLLGGLLRGGLLRSRLLRSSFLGSHYSVTSFRARFALENPGSLLGLCRPDSAPAKRDGGKRGVVERWEKPIGRADPLVPFGAPVRSIRSISDLRLYDCPKPNTEIPPFQWGVKHKPQHLVVQGGRTSISRCPPKGNKSPG